MTNYKATSAQWDDIEQWAKAGSNASTDHCILELLSRVESLEEDCYEESRSNHFCIEAIAKRLDKLEKTIYEMSFLQQH